VGIVDFGRADLLAVTAGRAVGLDPDRAGRDLDRPAAGAALGGSDRRVGQYPDSGVALETAGVDLHAAGWGTHLGEVVVDAEDAATDGRLALDKDDLGAGLGRFESGGDACDAGADDEQGFFGFVHG
jgi:hypothetical protein